MYMVPVKTGNRSDLIWVGDVEKVWFEMFGDASAQ